MNQPFHKVEGVEFEGDSLLFVADGVAYQVSVSAVSERLAGASQEQRRQFRVSPSGFGIHWLAVDEDLTVDGLISAAKNKYPVSPNVNLILNDKQKP